MIKITINGAGGKMGRTIIRLVLNDPELRLVGAVDSTESPNLGKDAGELAGTSKASVEVTSHLFNKVSLADVVIDFSSAGAIVALSDAAHKLKKPLIIGTTGHDSIQKQLIRRASQDIPIVFSPNMSVGVNLLWKLAEIASKIIGRDHPASIIERHHIHKKDSPSGTAKRLAEIISAATGTAAETIPIEAVREGEIVGEHTVSFKNDDELITLSHHAGTREIFARGALAAAKWVVSRPAGLYDMQDVLFGA